MGETVDVAKIDPGPCEAYFGSASSEYLGKTQGETQVQYNIETNPIETEQDGQVDEIINGDGVQVTIPIVYTDVDSLSNVIPWGNVVEGTGEKKLVIPKAVGTRMSDYADELTLHPTVMGESDKSRDINIHKCYPKPGPINFTYSRNGTRIANITFVGMEDSDGDYMTIGDKSITSA